MAWALNLATSKELFREFTENFGDYQPVIIGLAVILGCLIVAILYRRILVKRSPQTPKKLSPNKEIPLPKLAISLQEPLTLEPPANIFPSQWLGAADKVALAKYLEKVSLNATESFFRSLGELKPNVFPETERLKAASEQTAELLRRGLSAPELLEAINGGQSLSPENISLLALHLNELLPAFTMDPPETLSGELRPLVLGLMALLGSVLGYLLGGSLKLLGVPADTGLFLGSALGAGAGAGLSLFFAQNKKARHWLMAAVGGLAFLEGLMVLLKGAFWPSLLAFGRKSIFKRLLIWVGLIFLLILVKGQKLFDLSRYKDAVSQKTRNYLALTLPLVTVLMFRLNEPPPTQELSVQPKTSEEKELIFDVVRLVRRLKTQGRLNDEPSFGELVRKLTNKGYETEPLVLEGPRKLLWDDSLKDTYEPFGLIDIGQRVTIEDEPVIKDGQVVRKGLAVPE
jgi:hypothetical protein